MNTVQPKLDRSKSKIIFGSGSGSLTMKEAIQKTKHVPVLLSETVATLLVGGEKRVVDATLGGGGHTLALREKIIPSGGRLLSLDTDSEAIRRFEERRGVLAIGEEEITVVQANFSELGSVLAERDFLPVDAIMADLGYSSDQIEDGERGMSFLLEGPLDMRLDQEGELTAEKILATSELSELTRIFREYGDEEEAYPLAKAIVEARDKKPFRTTRELAVFIEEAYPAWKKRKQKIHPATKVFQALRIAVNDEMGSLERFLEAALEALRPGGRMALITFHSGEDRLVKHFFQKEEKGCVCPKEFPICVCGGKPRLKIITKKPLVADEKEVVENPRSRSAKLRVAEKV